MFTLSEGDYEIIKFTTLWWGVLGQSLTDYVGKTFDITLLFKNPPPDFWTSLWVRFSTQVTVKSFGPRIKRYLSFIWLYSKIIYSTKQINEENICFTWCHAFPIIYQPKQKSTFYHYWGFKKKIFNGFKWTATAMLTLLKCVNSCNFIFVKKWFSTEYCKEIVPSLGLIIYI